MKLLIYNSINESEEEGLRGRCIVGNETLGTSYYMLIDV